MHGNSLLGHIRIEVNLEIGQFRAEVLKNVSNRLLFAPFRDLALLLAFEYLFVSAHNFVSRVMQIRYQNRS